MKLTDIDGFILYENDNKSIFYTWLHRILMSTAKFNLMMELNNMQLNARAIENGYKEENVFYNKFDIPIYFVNLLLKDFGLIIEEVE